jgi:long-chain acyl-CoA synthetase
MLIESRLIEAFEIDPSANAVEADGVWSTWGQVRDLTRAVVLLLDEAQAPVGARVGILLRNRTPELCSLLACAVSARCAVAFNPLLPSDRLAQDILSQRPALIVGDRDILESEAVISSTASLAIPRLQVPTGSDGPVKWLDSKWALALSTAETKPEVIVEMLTSGTTGAPKRIALNRRNFDASFVQGLAYERQKTPWPALRRGVRIVSAPLTHISGVFAALTTLADGRQLALLEKFNVEKWVSAVERHGAKVGNIPPAALRMILDADVPKSRLASLVAMRSGTAPLDPAIIDAFIERYGLPVLGQYGATEFSGGVAGWSVDVFKEWYSRKRGSVGKMQAEVEGRIVDAEGGMVLEPGQQGLLELRGPQVDDGESWIRTTDRAALDSDGFLWIIGRADNAINRGGFKIMPDDVARTIEEHPSVKEAVVVGIPDSRLGEVPVAAITLMTSSGSFQVDGLRAFLSDKLLPYQIPAAIKVVEDFPRTPSLKPSTPEIRKLF